ncbi:YpjP family protein [Salipaludibacillus sp. LMS25]|jgi:hypothetical protein|uniref:YpjP family protein n=1 Tax=Salipaludibacillus sp. LMS25 TaxID=2924031 RepID=UPI0020D1D525|nr:YpjP family protein [Salipaludibacillus sp. LMS25]UTR13610.1 YpjP family protein [Salipaludibacillus sp. LMS25]
MKLRLKKIFAVLVTILTLGFYVPPVDLGHDAEKETDDLLSSANSASSADKESLLVNIDQENAPEETLSDVDFSELETSDNYVQQFTELAKEQTFHKLGPRISHKVEDDILLEVFPPMEEVITSLLDDLDDEEFPYLEIDEQTSSYYGEKIFNIYDNQSKEDVVRFHVRRDLRPKEGYWFNFHYHLREDNFEKHHNLGDIYWDKNTPPKWMT